MNRNRVIQSFLALGMLSFICISCTRRPVALETALSTAGENRKEMQKVLDYYQKKQEDSLKYKAACFLIENMPGYATYSYDSINSSFQPRKELSYDRSRWSLYLLAEEIFRRHIYMYPVDSLYVFEDIKTLTADYLINHIESVFRQKEKYAWLEDLSFEDFCEYLLPYRIGYEKPFSWRDSSLVRSDEFTKYLQNFDDTRVSSLLASNYIKPDPLFYTNNIKEQLPANINFQSIDCEDTANYYLLLFRLCGIPASIDIIPSWGNYDGQHAWTQPIEKRLRNTNNLRKFSWNIPKVYRRTYSIQKSTTKTGNEYQPPLFRDQRLKDVTEEYIHTVDVTETGFPKNTTWGYLCVFNRGEWKPVAQSDNQSGKCIFSKVGPGIIYLPAYFDKYGRLTATSHPFRLKNTGEKVYLQANGAPQDMLLHRKFPFESRKQALSQPIEGCIITASQNKSFYKCDTIRQINTSTAMQPIKISLEKNYQHFQFLFKSFFILAELYLFDNNGNRIFGHIQCKEMVSQKETVSQKEIFQDDNTLTARGISSLNVSVPPSDSVFSIHLLPLNDGNGIYPKNEYELFYFDKSLQWVSCGRKTADKFSIRFENVPQGGLYWLQNLTTGKEERIFTYENGKQRFW